MLPGTLVELAREVGSERDALLRAAAALQLMPENATKWVRFERLLEVACGSVATDAQSGLSAGRLVQLLTGPPIASGQVLSGEDPFEETFTATVAFHGGSYRVVMGGAAGQSAACQLILEAARLLPEASRVRREVMLDASVLLPLSEAMCERAGLSRWRAAECSKSSPIIVPDQVELDRLSRCATFTEDEFNAVADLDVARHLGLIAPRSLGIHYHDDENPTDGRCYLCPIVELTTGDLLVALPGGIPASITHRALVRAVEDDAANVMVQALHNATHIKVRQYFHRINWTQIAAPSGLDDPSLVQERFYEVDIGMMAHVVSIIDPLTNYRAGEPFAEADFLVVQEELNERLSIVRTALRTTSNVSVLHVVVTPMFGRASVMGFIGEATDEGSNLLTISPDDLDTITRLESHERLALWRFAQAASRLHEGARVLSFSTLDEYAIYRDNQNSFYLSDEARPNFVSIAVGSGATLRTEERCRTDAHLARVPDDGVFVEMARWEADGRTPIYRPDDPRRESLHLVEIAAPCWVIPSPESDAERVSSEDLAVAIAFWIWRCRGLLAPALTRLTAPLVVRVRFAEQSITSPTGLTLEPPTSWLSCEPDAESGVTLTLLDGAAARMFGPGNEAERLMAGSLVCAVEDFAGLANARPPQEIAESLPAGPMRMLQVFRDSDDLFFLFGYTTMPRLVSSADVGFVLDAIGEVAANIAGITEGPIPRDRRTKLLNGVVEHLFSELRSRLLALDENYLLEMLIGEQEALLYREARDRLLIPSQAACFGEDSEAVVRSLDRERDLTTTSIANRFLIEFASAIGGSGSEPPSSAGYDRLIALASQIVQLGLLSDALFYGLSSSDLAILPSGRLGIGREDPYHSAIDSYRQLISDSALDLAQAFYPRHWRVEPDQDAEPFDPSELNAAFEAEFGVTATEVAQLSGDLMQLGRDAPHQVASWAFEDLISHLVQRQEWEEPRLRSALALLSMGPLDYFPPTGRPADVFPWRFSRERSAARRPVALRNRSGRLEAVWGPRAIHRSSRYLFDLIHTDRLNSRSDRMKRYVTLLRQEVNDRFQHEVAQLFASAGARVSERVTQFGKLRLLRADGNPMGDVDVLVLDNRQKVMVAVEVKDFELARTPAELSNEMKKLLQGHKSAAGHHEERLSFLREHRDEVHSGLGLSGSPGDWQIQGAIVTSHNLMAIHFPIARASAKRLNLVSFEELTDQWKSQGRLVRRRPDSTARRKRGRRGR